MQDHSNDFPIGVFDSGVGGLSVLKHIRRHLPNESLVYLADSFHAPYGNRPTPFILERAIQLSEFLINENRAKAVVIACNTATAIAVNQLRQQFSVPIIGMEPGIKPAIAQTQSKVIGILATTNTLASEKFRTLIQRYQRPDISIIIQPCPGLVEQIEHGDIHSQTTYELIQQYVQPLVDNNADTLVLGCTHYPFVSHLIKKIAPQCEIIETGLAVAMELSRQLNRLNFQQPLNHKATLHYWTSKIESNTSEVVERLLGESVDPRLLAQPKTPITPM